MTHEFLRTLAVVLGVAAVTTVVFQRLKQPVVFGYMLAGLIVGPHLPVPLIADEAIVKTLSELGVILLMFSLGLEFHLRRLMQAGWSVVVIAALETSFMIWLGHEAGRALGWSPIASLYAGAAVAISSTTIIVKAFADRGMRGGATERVFGILIMEDLIAILLLALLTPAGSQGGSAPDSVWFTIFRLSAFLVAFLVIGMLMVPRAMRFVVAMRRPEITLVVSMGLCFGAATLVQSMGYSVALGAFLAGALVAESGESKVVERLAEPVRDMFLAVFFVSVGMMIVPKLVLEHAGAVIGFTLLVVLGKIVAVSFASFLTGANIRASLQTAMSMAQIGEFSFIIAAAGVASGSTPASHYPIIVAVSALTTLTTPWLIRFADPVAAWIDRNLPRRVQTFAVLYGTWVENARKYPGSQGDRRLLVQALRAVAIDAAVVAGLSIGMVLGAVPLGDRLSDATGLGRLAARAAIVMGAIALSVPFLMGIVSTGRRLGDLLARRAFATPVAGKLDPAAAPRRAMVVAVQLATLLAVGAPLIAFMQPFLPAFAGLVLLLVGASVLGVVFWRSAADLQGHVRAAAEAIVAAIGDHNRATSPVESARSLQRAYDLVPGLGEPVPVEIMRDSPYVGRTLADTQMRGRTGATVLAISRGQDVVLVPDGHVELEAGDVLALAGTAESVEAAKHLLAYGAPPPSA